jgi:hypothetical protein
LVLDSSRPWRRAAALEVSLVQQTEESEGEDSSNRMALIAARDPEKDVVPPLPPRYRLRDLILGDYAFNDDGER